LRFDVTNLYVTPTPKLIHIRFLFSQQCAEPLRDNPIQRPFRAAGNLVRSSGLGGVVCHVLCEADGAARLSGDVENHLTKIVPITGPRMIRTVAFEGMVNGAGQRHAGPAGAVYKDDAAILRVAHPVLQNFSGKRLCPTRVVSVLSSFRLWCPHLRRNDDGRCSIQKGYFIGDGSHVALLKGD
jgi:hypothetical protein